MKNVKTLILLLMALLCQAAFPQGEKLFGWNGESLSYKQNNIALGMSLQESDNPMRDQQIFRTYKLSSKDGSDSYSVSLVGPSSTFDGVFESVVIKDSKGNQMLFRVSNGALGNVCNITANQGDEHTYFIQVPLDERSFALIFGGRLFDGNVYAGEMLIIVINKDKATVVYDKPAFGYKYTPYPNFSMEFTDKILWNENADGIIDGARADMSSKRYRIWQEGSVFMIREM